MIPLQLLFNVYTDNKNYANRIFEDIVLAQQPAHLWYLIMIFNIFIMFRILEDKINKNGYLFNFTILSIIKVVSILIPNIYQISSSLQYLIYFYMGYVFSRESNNINNINLKFLFIFHLLLFNINYLILQNMPSNIIIKLVRLLTNTCIAIIGIMFLFILVSSLCNNEKVRKVIENNNVYKLVDKYNFQIYLLHQPIMLSMISLLKYNDIKPGIMFWILFGVTLIISLIMAILINNIKNRIKKYSNTLKNTYLGRV